MKNLLFIVSIIFLTFTSCTKEVIEPRVEEVQIVEEEVRIYGKWLLLDATMYIENLETHEKTQFNHFDANKTVSSIRFSGPMYDFEVIEQNVTTWSFYQPQYVPGYGEFVLNDDTANPMGFYVTKSNWQIVEHPLASNASEMQLGGSARPIEAYIDDYGQEIVKFSVQLAYENIGGYNCKYFTQMRMQKIDRW
jgi:hypothetical protein